MLFMYYVMMYVFFTSFDAQAAARHVECKTDDYVAITIAPVATARPRAVSFDTSLRDERKVDQKRQSNLQVPHRRPCMVQNTVSVTHTNITPINDQFETYHQVLTKLTKKEQWPQVLVAERDVMTPSRARSPITVEKEKFLPDASQKFLRDFVSAYCVMEDLADSIVQTSHNSESLSDRKQRALRVSAQSWFVKDTIESLLIKNISTSSKPTVAHPVMEFYVHLYPETVSESRRRTQQMYCDAGLQTTPILTTRREWTKGHLASLLRDILQKQRAQQASVGSAH